MKSPDDLDDSCEGNDNFNKQTMNYLSENYDNEQDVSTVISDHSYCKQNIDLISNIDEVDTEMSNQENSINMKDNLKQTEDIEGTFKLDRFLRMDSVLEILTSESQTILDSIPKTYKENIYFVYNNKVNMEHLRKGRKLEFWDNCDAVNDNLKIRDIQYVKNVKKQVNKEKHPGSNRANIADDIQTLINMNSEPNGFIKELIFQPGKLPHK
ncbi:hypothetical protein KUTeg_018076 [Tegillarca granosa]|uniref:Uncharacterized protein n=1 Tax=Tegillarca granosa TaxID=220873 RepID=A0ABQ9EGS6_TEGGR|nr:hypothetical protein KUTeg_018076 [Tegillarca granosa]